MRTPNVLEDFKFTASGVTHRNIVLIAESGKKKRVQIDNVVAEECGSQVKNHCEWEHPGRWRDSCKKKGVGRVGWKTKTSGTFYKDNPQHNLRDRDTEDHTFYDPNNQRSGKASGNRDY